MLFLPLLDHNHFSPIIGQFPPLSSFGVNLPPPLSAHVPPSSNYHLPSVPCNLPARPHPLPSSHSQLHPYDSPLGNTPLEATSHSFASIHTSSFLPSPSFPSLACHPLIASLIYIMNADILLSSVRRVVFPHSALS